MSTFVPGKTHLTPGQQAPEFNQPDQQGATISLSGLKGKKILLFFYPKDDTPGCTKEACNLRDNYAWWQNQGYEVIGISPDSERRHQNFVKKYELPFTLLSDPQLEMIRAYGVWGWKKFMGREYEGLLRTTFVIDEKGIIQEVITKVDTGNHTEQIQQALGV